MHSDDTIKAMDFEAAFAALDETVRTLESGQGSLEDAVAQYEQGRKLAARCQALLDAAELRVRQLDDDGQLSDF